MNTGIKEVTKQVGIFVTKNSSTILTGIGVGGFISTVVMAVNATPKALQLIDEAYEGRESTSELSKLEVVKVTWKCYLPTAITAALSISCIIGANSINLKRNAALASVYSVAKKSLDTYQAKVIETIGEKKNKEIREEIVKDTLERTPVNEKQVIITGKGDMLCFDECSGRYFKGNIEDIRKAENKLNKDLICDMWVSLNDLYDELGLDTVKIGDDIGWTIDNNVQFDFTSKIADNGEPCIVVGFWVDPAPKPHTY